ncbi:MAG TPA: AAA family ATPase, partial [Ktedonobacteraceae bacterium]|nr:AAA family ATPase [Ktedonobacteraceae bacterium]
EAKSLRQQQAAQQAAAQDLKAQIEQRAVRIQEAQAQFQALRLAIDSHRSQLEEAQARAQELTHELQRAEEKAGELDKQILAIEQETLQLRQALNELEVAYRRCLLDSQKARDAVDALLQQLQEEMGVADPGELAHYAARNDLDREGSEESGAGDQVQAAASDVVTTLSEEEEAQLRKLRRRVDSLRSRLKALGGSDPDAPRQYEETRMRYEFLTTQITDMEQAALHLRAIIGQLDATMARQFETTFEAVNARFSEHFTTLFNGGHARLELLAAKSEEDGESQAEVSAMPAGVEVIVQPPGKKVQDLALLSGGERALVSAALLFALLEINPPPFCLLDEVDAALDESNVTRFCEILKRLAQRTQFIVITHNRVTMVEAQVIYGVSMGGDSVSRLLSMKLEEIPVAGDR